MGINTNCNGMKTTKIRLTLLGIVFSLCIQAQQKPFRVAFFTPLYLDSSYADGVNYRFGNTFPKYVLAGLDFYLGASFAADSLDIEGNNNLKLYVFDTRSRSQSIGNVNTSPIMDSIDLIIGSVAGADYLQLAQIAQQRQIPFVSATYPNDGGIRNNPYVLMASPKLNSHLLATYNYLLRQHGTHRLIYVRRTNSADDRLQEVFNTLNRGQDGNPVIRMQSLLLKDSVTTEEISPYLDTLRENVIVTGSLDEAFGRSLATAFLPYAKPNIKLTLMGMPTWESIRDLQKPEYRDLAIVYSNSFFNSKNPWSISFEEKFRKKTYSRPSDVAFKGYELTWFFYQLWKQYGSEFIKHLDDKRFTLMTEFDFKAIRISSSSTNPDYFENKMIYLVKRQGGQSTLAQ